MDEQTARQIPPGGGACKAENWPKALYCSKGLTFTYTQEVRRYMHTNWSEGNRRAKVWQILKIIFVTYEVRYIMLHIRDDPYSWVWGVEKILPEDILRASKVEER